MLYYRLEVESPNFVQWTSRIHSAHSMKDTLRVSSSNDKIHCFHHKVFYDQVTSSTREYIASCVKLDKVEPHVRSYGRSLTVRAYSPEHRTFRWFRDPQRHAHLMNVVWSVTDTCMSVLQFHSKVFRSANLVSKPPKPGISKYSPSRRSRRFHR